MKRQDDHKNDYASMINSLLHSKDPALVGVRGILKKKKDEIEEFPMHSLTMNQFSEQEGTGKRKFTKEEQHVLELEKNLIELKNQIEFLKSEVKKTEENSFKKGFQEGENTGRKSGYEKASKEYNDKLHGIEERLALILRNIESSRKKMYLDAEKDILALSVLMAEKICCTEITLNREVIVRVVKNTLEHISDRQKIIVRVAKDDLDLIMEKKDLWLVISERSAQVSVEFDSQLQPGSCIIESPSGIADSRLHIKLEEIHDVLSHSWNSFISQKSAELTP